MSCRLLRLIDEGCKMREGLGFIRLVLFCHLDKKTKSKTWCCDSNCSFCVKSAVRPSSGADKSRAESFSLVLSVTAGGMTGSSSAVIFTFKRELVICCFCFFLRSWFCFTQIVSFQDRRRSDHLHIAWIWADVWRRRRRRRCDISLSPPETKHQ